MKTATSSAATAWAQAQLSALSVWTEGEPHTHSEAWPTVSHCVCFVCSLPSSVLSSQEVLLEEDGVVLLVHCLSCGQQEVVVGGRCVRQSTDTGQQQSGSISGVLVPPPPPPLL